MPRYTGIVTITLAETVSLEYEAADDADAERKLQLAAYHRDLLLAIHDPDEAGLRREGFDMLAGATSVLATETRTPLRTDGSN